MAVLMTRTRLCSLKTVLDCKEAIALSCDGEKGQEFVGWPGDSAAARRRTAPARGDHAVAATAQVPPRESSVTQSLYVHLTTSFSLLLTDVILVQELGERGTERGVIWLGVRLARSLCPSPERIASWRQAAGVYQGGQLSRWSTALLKRRQRAGSGRRGQCKAAAVSGDAVVSTGENAAAAHLYVYRAVPGCVEAHHLHHLNAQPGTA